MKNILFAIFILISGITLSQKITTKNSLKITHGDIKLYLDDDTSTMVSKLTLKYSDFKKQICILPSDYFCCGSGFGSSFVPSTKNMFIQHKFTGSWLK